MLRKVFATNLRCFLGGTKPQRQGSSYEAPGAAALNHCLKPPAQVEGAPGGVEVILGANFPQIQDGPLGSSLGCLVGCF